MSQTTAGCLSKRSSSSSFCTLSHPSVLSTFHPPPSFYLLLFPPTLSPVKTPESPQITVGGGFFDGVTACMAPLSPIRPPLRFWSMLISNLGERERERQRDEHLQYPHLFVNYPLLKKGFPANRTPSLRVYLSE